MDLDGGQMLNVWDLKLEREINYWLWLDKSVSLHPQHPPDGVVDELDVVQVAVELQAPPHVGEVIEAGVQGHHLAAQPRHRHREHADVGAQVWSCIIM